MGKLIPIVVLLILPIILSLSLYDTKNPSEDDKKLMLAELRNRVNSILKEDHMKDDFYLIRFLKASNFDLEKAELMLRNNLLYRKENNMEKIQEEDWSDMEKDFPYRVDGLDKLGRPIIQIDFLKWDINKATDEGKLDRVRRHFDKMLDEATRKVVKLRAEGKNVTQWTFLANMKDVNLNEHINFKSVRFYYDVTSNYESNQPGMASNVLLLNSPLIFDPIMSIIRSLMTDETKKNFIAYRNPDEWKPIMDNLVDSDQLPAEYGGNKGSKPKTNNNYGFERHENGSWGTWKGY